MAVVDERPGLRQGDIVPESIGDTRNGYGIPSRVKTATKNPLAQEIAEVVARGFGASRKLAPPMAFADAESAKAALGGTGTDRQILVRIQQLHSDTLIRTELDYDFVVEVYDAPGRLIASTRRANAADLGGNALLPACQARESVLRTTGTVQSHLLSIPEIRSSLE